MMDKPGQFPGIEEIRKAMDILGAFGSEERFAGPGQAGIVRSAMEAMELAAEAVQEADKHRRRLVSMFQGIRRVNRLIVGEKSPARLIQGVCDILVETRGVNAAFIILAETPKRIIGQAASGVAEEKFRLLMRRMARGVYPACFDQACESADAVSIRNSRDICMDCPLVEDHPDRGAITASLFRQGRRYGWLVVSAPARFADDPQERSLIRELSDDIAMALENIERDKMRKENRKRLEASEARYRRLHETMRDAFVQVDMTGKIIDFNKAFQLMIGYAEQEIPFLTYPQITPAKWHELEQRLVAEKILTGGHSGVYEKEYIRKDGTVFPVELSTFLVRDDAGEPESMWAIVRDISRRKNAEAAILRERSQALALLDGIEDVIYVADPDTYELLYVNAICRKIWGEDIVGRKCHQVLQNRQDPCDFCTNALIFGEYLGRTYEWEFQNEVSKRWYRCADKAVEWVDGRMVRFELAVDTTAVKEAAHELLRIRMAVEEAGDAIGISTPEGRHFYQNKAFTELFGYDVREVENRSPKTLYADPKVGETVFSSVMAGESWAGEVEMRAKDGRTIPVLLRADAVRDESGRIVSLLGIHTNISERKAMERKLERTLDELLRSNRELEQFAYVASHDLQEPLRMVSSFTQLLADRYGDRLDEKARKYIDFAVDGATRMQGLIQALLAYSRVNSRGGDLEPTDSGRALESALLNLTAAVEETGAHVKAEELPVVRADAVQLAQLFQNLIGNSIKFRGEAPPEIRVFADRYGSIWRFGVADNGIGIDEKYSDKVFEIFQRLHARSQYSGTGIGLSLCKRIVERHGGEIWFESNPGNGAVFYLTLNAV